MEKIKLLYLTPHLSTGGMPQFVLKRLQSLQKHKDKIEVFLVEYSQFSDCYLVQRNKILELLDEEHFISLGWFTETEKKGELIKILKDKKIDIIHFEEIPEGFESFNKIPNSLLNQIYDNRRTWKIVETCHNNWYQYKDKHFNPDYYCFVTPYHSEVNFKNSLSQEKLIMYPYDDMVKPVKEEFGINNDVHTVPMLKKLMECEKLGLDPSKINVLNVGLWTEGKNQKEGIEIARHLQDTHPDIHFHFVGNQAENFESYWKPIMENLPKNVTVWGERSDVDSFMYACDVMMFNSVNECNPLAIRESVGYGMKILARNLIQYMGMFDKYITPINSNDINQISQQLVTLINSNETYIIEQQIDFGDDHLRFYQDVMKSNFIHNEPLIDDFIVNQHFVVNPFLEIIGPENKEYEVKMYDNETLVYETKLKSNSWLKLNKEYFIKWKTVITDNRGIVYENVLNLNNKRVFISFGSKSLGDTLAWLPYCEEFRKKHNCELIVSTFLNNIFIDQYPEIQFVNPGDIVPNIYAQYNLGWFYNEDGNVNFNKNKIDFKTIPLQQTATDILGLDYEEIRPKLNLPKLPKKKKVGIGFHSTAQSKYWNNPNGWQEVIDHLNNLGYECVIYSKEGDGYMNNHYPKGVTIFEGKGLQSVIDDMVTCEFFIGLSSGLSWLAWACKLPVVLISGFTEKWTETTLDTYRVINENVCNGCFNKYKLDSGDWNWCPIYKNTNKQFECTKKISSKMVINEIEKITNKNNNIILSEDSVTIVLSHADNEWRKFILDECLENITGEIILSTNYPVEPKTQKLCDWVLYNKNNPLLTKDEFKRYNVSYDYWFIDSNGEKVTTPLDYDHGYSAYTLIQQGIKFAKQIGKNKVHIINYDYVIDNNNITQNNILLNSFDTVFYTYKEKTYTEDSYCVGFFSGNVDELDKIFSHYKNKEEYYKDNHSYKILEVVMYNLSKNYNLNVKELFYEDLNSITNREGVLMFSKGNNFNRFKYISDKYECDKTSRHEYHKIYDNILKPISDEVFNLFEIGIDRGKSVNVWKDYLKNAKIYGLDITQEWTHNRGKVFKGDQNNIDDLNKVINSIDKCKIIIDDGSHNPNHQIKTFYHLFENLLEDGGFYIIEDIETSYWNPSSSLYGYEVGYLNVVDYFTKLNHQVNNKYNNIENKLNIESIKFTSNAIIIKKYNIR